MLSQKGDTILLSISSSNIELIFTTPKGRELDRGEEKEERGGSGGKRGGEGIGKGKGKGRGRREGGRERGWKRGRGQGCTVFFGK